MSLAGGYPLSGVTITTKKKKNKGKKKKSVSEAAAGDSVEVGIDEVKEPEVIPTTPVTPAPVEKTQQSETNEQPSSAKQTGKNKKKQQNNKREVEDRSRSTSDPSSAEPPPTNQAVVNNETHKENQFKAKPDCSGGKSPTDANLHNLAIEAADFASKYSNISDLKEAESKYYNYLAKTKKESPKPGNESDDIDFFASDEESASKAKPKLMAVKPKQLKKIKEHDKKKDSNQVKEPTSDSSITLSLAEEIAKARELIKNSLECLDRISLLANKGDALIKIQELEAKNKALNKDTDGLRKLVGILEGRISSLENSNKVNGSKALASHDEDDDIDLFGSSEEEEDAAKTKVREERLKAYADKKSKKPALIAKTSVLLDVKPWGDETDLNEMLVHVKSIEKDGLVWGADKRVPIGYGINKLQVMCVVEDEKVSIDELCEEIQEFTEFVQSVDIAAMSKI